MSYRNCPRHTLVLFARQIASSRTQQRTLIFCTCVAVVVDVVVAGSSVAW